MFNSLKDAKEDNMEIKTINDVRNLSRPVLDQLAYALIMRRQYDGLNDRTWNTSEHLKWENIIRALLDIL